MWQENVLLRSELEEMGLFVWCPKLLATLLAHLSSLAAVSLCSEHPKSHAKMPPLLTSSVTRRETKGVTETQSLFQPATYFCLQACPVFFPPWVLGPLRTLCSYCQFSFYPSSCRTTMDAKKPRKCSLTSFPVLKTRKKQDVNPVKVKILEFHLGSRGIIMKTWGPWTQW